MCVILHRSYSMYIHFKYREKYDVGYELISQIAPKIPGIIKLIGKILARCSAAVCLPEGVDKG